VKISLSLARERLERVRDVNQTKELIPSLLLASEGMIGIINSTFIILSTHYIIRNSNNVI